MVKSHPWKNGFYGVRCSGVELQVQRQLPLWAMPGCWQPWQVAVHLELFELQEASLWRWWRHRRWLQ